jgi:hypothetical protein
VLAIILALVGTKMMRRRRRRSRGTPAQRVSGGWRELVDLAVDLGAARPGRETRRVVVGRIGRPDLSALAGAADAVAFGPVDPDETVATRYWEQVDHTRIRILRDVGRWRRFSALLSLGSLNGPRFRRRSRDGDHRAPDAARAG